MNGLKPGLITTLKRMALFAMIFVGQAVHAADDIWQTHEANPVWKSECEGCHMAFPPSLLAKENWQLIMQGLDKHFGVDASLDVKTRDEISAFLERNAGSSWTRSSSTLRFTDTQWFLRKHSGAMRMIAKGRVKSLMDCVACHQ